MHAALESNMRKSPAFRALAIGLTALLLAALAACSSSGGAPTTVNLWQNIIPSNRCGGCHHQGGQSPMFARSDDVNLAYQAALPLVDLTNPSQSTLVLKVGGGHNCWVADPSACALTMTTWIQNWIGQGSSSTTTVQLVAPPVQTAGGGKQFPADPTVGNPSYQSTVYPLLTKFCSGCHNPASASPQQPYFADPNNIDAAYIAAQPKIDLAQPDQSRFYERLATEFHHCWPTASSNG